MNAFSEKLMTGTFRLLSRLPLRALYVISDIAAPIVHHVVRYRRDVVRRNLSRSFPEKSEKQRRLIERKFYGFLCDYAMETIKLITISPEEMRRRMQFEGVQEMEKSLETHPFVFVYLGHYGNWEWISSLPLWVSDSEKVHCAQLYRPLRNKAFDRLFMQMRTRWGAENISKYDTLRRIVSLKKEDKRTIVGFIADQSPSSESVHDWVEFFHQDTPVVTGTERIGKKMNAAIYFADVIAPRRGNYVCRFRRITEDPKKFEDYRLTDFYMQELEKMIRRHPHLWLWSHNRWKRTRQTEQSV